MREGMELLRGCFLLYLLLVCASGCWSYPDGAPDDACGNLFPSGHGVPFTAGNGGYKLTVSGNVTEVESGVPIQVNVISSNVKFIGFMCEAVAGAGSFVILEEYQQLSQLICNQNAVTHTLATGNGLTGISFMYSPPSTPGFGSVILNATVVHEKIVFYRVDPIILKEVENKVPSASSSIELVDGHIDVKSPQYNNVTLLFASPPPGSKPILTYTVEAIYPPLTSFITIYTGLSLSPSVMLPSGLNVSVRVKAANDIGVGPYSPTYSFLTARSGDPLPPPPTSLTAVNLEQTSFTLVWNATIDPSGFTILYYHLQQQQSNGKWIEIDQTSSTSYSVSSVSPGATYSYRLLVSTLAGTSLPSPPYNVTTRDCPHSCSGHGRCSPIGTCMCDADYVNYDCSIRTGIPLQCFGDNDLCLQWRVVDEHVHIRMIVSETDGWFALGLGASDGMTGANIFRVTVESNYSLTLTDMHASTFDYPHPDLIQDINPNTVTGFTNETHADVIFSRKLHTNDPADFIISNVSGALIAASYAFHSGMYFDPHSPDDCGRFKIDFIGYRIETTEMLFWYYTPVVAALVMIPLFSLCLQLSSKSYLSSSPLSLSWWNRPLFKHISSPVWMDTLTLNFRQTLQDLTVLEFALICIYGVMVFVFVWMGRNAFSDFGKDPVYVVGHLSAVHLALGLLPVTRNSLLSILFASSFERLIKYHRWIMRITIVFLWVHLFTMLNLFGNDKFLENAALPHGASALSGFIAFLVMNSIALFALEPIRRRFFEFFYYSHMLLWPVAIAMAMLHSIYFRYYAIAPLSLYVFDRIIRFYRGWRRVSIVDASVLSTGVHGKHLSMLQLQIDNFSYTPGQYVFVNIPDISIGEWHPFSITSAPTLPGAPFTLHALDMGSNTFTQKLSNWIIQHKYRHNNGSSANVQHHPSSSSSSSLSSPSWPAIKVDGPHGRLSLSLTGPSKSIILVGGGVGVTPLISIASSLLPEDTSSSSSLSSSPIQHIHLIWVVRHADVITDWFPHQLNAFKQHPHRFHLHLYCTNSGNKGGPLLQTHNDYQALPCDDPSSTSSSSSSSSSVVVPADEVLTRPRGYGSLGSKNRLSIEYHEGVRPNIPQLFESILGQHVAANIQAHEIIVFTSGPVDLMTSVHKTACAHGMALSKETFLL